MQSLNTLFDEITNRIEAQRSGIETGDAVPSGYKYLDRVLMAFKGCANRRRACRWENGFYGQPGA
jgi:hypothetical protein